MLTIYDIAKKTGYSAPTVSKALNGTGYLSSKTREIIVKAAEEMGYKPNIVARTLTTKKSGLIGVVFDDSRMQRGFDHPLYGGLLNTFRALVEDAGYDIIFLSSRNKMTYVDHSMYRSVDGVIILNPDIDRYEDLMAIHDKMIPCVSTSVVIPDVCAVLTDNVKGGYDAAQYLLSKGHRRIAYLSGPIDKITPSALERFNGFKHCLLENNVPFDQNLFEECKYWHLQSGYEGIARLYERTNDFTAVFTSSDLIALGVMRYAAEHKISIPDELSIVGFDDDRIASFCTPLLTTFRQDRDNLAEISAEMLFQSISGIPVPESIRIPARFIERDSVADIS